MLAPRLKLGDTIGIVSPSMALRPDQKRRLDKGAGYLQKLGFEVKFAPGVFARDRLGVSAGEGKDRARDINRFFADDSVKAIWCSVGGDTANEILEYLDYRLIRRHPKIIMGLSDITVLINAIYHKTGLVTFHAGNPMAGRSSDTFNPGYSHEQFLQVLVNGVTGDIPKLSPWKTVRPGRAVGKLVGGNLNCLLKLVGTEFFPPMKQHILLLETYSTGLSEAIFKLTQLRHMGVFDQIVGCVVGYCYLFEHDQQFDGGGQRIFFEDVLKKITRDYDFPVLKIKEFGHRCPNTPLPIGGVAEMDSGKKIFRTTRPFLSK